MVGVAFDQVTKRFGGTTAVDRLDLVVDDGEFMVLLGPSGCGKTTALRMVAGLESVTEGKISIGDRVVNDVEPRDRDVAMVFQSYALYPHLTVAKNIESPLMVRPQRVEGEAEPRKLTHTERTQRIAEAARALGLEPYLGRKPGALSGGQRQRVALARAIVTRPRVFLMDEPLSNLDAKLRTQTRTELVELHRRFPATVLYVTHDQIEAMTMATRIAVMSDGHLQQVGTPKDIYDRPANLFVARFIGAPPMNTFDATVVVADGRPVLAVGADRLAVPVGARGALVEGQQVVVGLRPEHLALGRTDTGPSLTGRVVNIEWLGHESLVVADVGDQRVTIRQRTGQAQPVVGETAPLAVRPDQVHVFDADTGQRIG
ncbi:MAG TPA: ATP-binding cassette domain-containing protein [Acidimicrobiales bacterium]|jgi:ABC-type sugar transport system ATPase subunit|nr:ATP-binding cassette domain-containing protein [Acidimicrobiales bacterium]